MARTMPGGAPDYTSQIAAREAAANDALTKLYISLAARKEERLRQQEFMKEMLGLRDQYTRGMYEDFGAPGSPDRSGKYPNYRDGVNAPVAAPLGSGGAGSGAPAPAAAPTMQQPQGAIPGSAPTGPPIGKFGALQQPQQQDTAQNDPLSSFAQAGPDETVTLSAQTRQQRPAYNDPRLPSTTRGTPQRFRDIDPKLLAAWDEAEQKFKLPRGTIMMTLGLENAGGYNIGTNPKSAGGASGFFQFTQELAREHGLKPADLQDPYKMGYALAANIDRNRTNMEKFAGRKFTDSSADMPYYYMAHMWGAGNAPRIAKALQVNRDVPLASVIMPTKLPNGRVVDGATTLANNNIPLNMTVGQYFDKLATEKVAPWHSAALRYMDAPQTQTATADANAPRPPANVPQGANYASPRTGYRFRDEANMVSVPFPDGSGRSFVVHRDAAPIADKFISRLYEAGAPIGSIGGYAPRMIAGTRTPSQHGFGMSIDVNQSSRNRVNAPFTKWVQANPQVLGGILADLGIRSGGDWRRPDFGHFEFGPEALEIERGGGTTKVATPATPQIPPPPPRLPSEEMRPFAGEKVATFNAPAAGQVAVMGNNKPIVEKGAIPSTAIPGLIAGMKPTTVPKQQIAAPTTPTVVPTTAPVPDEATATTNQPTPQVASEREQPTQAIPAPTPQQVQTDSGYTADDMDERAATRLSKDEQIPLPIAKPPQSAAGMRGLRDVPPGVVVPPAGDVLEALGQGARDIRGAADDLLTKGGEIAGDIGWAAGDILKGPASVARDIRSVDPMTQVVQGAGDLVGDATTKLLEALKPVPMEPSYNVPPQVQRMMEQRSAQQAPPVSTPTPLPVPAPKVTEAIYDTHSGGAAPDFDPSAAGSGPDVLSWIKNLFKSTPQQPTPTTATAAPVAVGKVKAEMPGGTPIIVQQPPLNIQPKGAVGALPQAPAGTQLQPGQVDVQYDENGNPLFKMVE